MARKRTDCPNRAARSRLVKDRDDTHYLRAARLIAIAASVFTVIGASVLAYSKNKTIGIRRVGNVPMNAGRIRAHPRRFTPGSISNGNHPVNRCVRKAFHVLWVKSAGFHASLLQETSGNWVQVRPRLHTRTDDFRIAPPQRSEKGLGNLAPSRVPRTHKEDCLVL